MRRPNRFSDSGPALAVLLCTTLVYPQLGVAAPTTATAEPGARENGPDGAKQHFERGVDLFADGDFASALFEFDNAYALTSNAHLLYNIAVCHYELHEYAAATVAYRKYLAQLENSLDDDRRQQVRDRLDKLDLRVGTVIVESVPSGAVVSSGGDKLGVTPLEVTLDLGERDLTLTREGYQDTAAPVRVVGGERVSVEVELKRAAAPAAVVAKPAVAPAAAEPEPLVDDGPGRSGDRGVRIGAIVAASVAGAAGIGAAVAGGLAVAANRDLESERQRPTTRESLSDLASSRDTLALTTDILIGITAGAAVTAVALGAVYLARRNKASGRTARVRVDPSTMRIRF
ncbi:MAG: PEGA domain-containing protein [Myxococcota bacterium]